MRKIGPKSTFIPWIFAVIAFCLILSVIIISNRDPTTIFHCVAGALCYAQTKEALRLTPPPALLPSNASHTPTASNPLEFSTPTLTFTSTTSPITVPISHLTVDQSVSISEIRMVDSVGGWAIGHSDNSDNYLDRLDHVLKTVDGGVTWQDVTPPEPARVDDFWQSYVRYQARASGFFANATTAWVAYNSAENIPSEIIPPTVWRTQDGGQTWTRSQPLPHKFARRPSLIFIDAQTGWLMNFHFGMALHGVNIFATTDRGRTWNEVANPDDEDENSREKWIECNKDNFTFMDSYTGWVVGTCWDGRVYFRKTVDGGLTWQSETLLPPTQAPQYCNPFLVSSLQIQSSLQFGAFIVECVDGSKPTPLTYDFLYVTQDGGQTWLPHLLPMPELQRPIVEFINPSVGWLIGTISQNSSQVYQTQDGGKRWTPLAKVDGLARRIDYIDKQTGWIVMGKADGSQQTLMQTLDGGQSWEDLQPRIGN